MAEPVDAILDYWFGELDPQGLCIEDKQSLWFKSSEETDRYCKATFGKWVTAALEGELDHWRKTDRGLMALILLLDQMTRNILRGTPGAFSGDSQALSLAQGAIEEQRNLRLPAIYQVFLYLPLEHSEDIEYQEESVALFRALEVAQGTEAIAGFTRYAIAHREVIALFGRFPHRNEILGRASTASELEYMETHGGF